MCARKEGLLLSLGLVELGVAVDRVEEVPGGDDEDAARGRHLVPHVVHHVLAQLEGVTVEVDPAEVGHLELITTHSICYEGQ